MAWFRKSVAIVLLGLWMPVTMHCLLEAMPAFSFLQCCCTADKGPQEPNDCADDACSALESGLYKIEDNSALAPHPSLLFALSTCDPGSPLPAERVPRLAPQSLAPPELPQFWQFSYRTALPPRAPSFVA